MQRDAICPASHAVFYWAVEFRPAVSTAPSIGSDTCGRAPSPTPFSLPTAGGEDRRRPPAPIIFSGRWHSWGIVAKTPEHEVDDKMVPRPVALFVDGKDLGRFKDASRPAFSRDGKHLAYLVEKR